MPFLIWDRSRCPGGRPSPRWAQEFSIYHNMVGRAIKSPVGGVTLTLFQAGSSFVLEVPLSLEHHRLCGQDAPDKSFQGAGYRKHTDVKADA